ncbi:DUF5077 domain-containing protein [Niabella pedocola]|uniref:DUF5077 domain-containing protein n=1 Tax=Niabella pedocola TaxID=1752077 RepID=A0ABS8PVL2_9BACT|nr:DUF5077 domain-containing protein [Niabella pedocola]MCD2425111.1 DUF5077 domain-containing protein [Niabella pedocola]
MKATYKIIVLLCACYTLLSSCDKRSGIQEKGDGANAGAITARALSDLTVAIPMGGNSFVMNDATGATIYDDSNFGLRNWTNLSAVTSTYFKVANTGTLYLGIKGYVTTGTSVVRLTVNGQSFDVTMTGGAPAKTYYAGSVNISTPGYVKVDLKGISKTSTYIGNMTDIMIGGPAAGTGLIYASDANNFYWSRRGPSVHLNHTLTSGNTYEWMYNEVTVPSGQDAIGSYYMVNGFGQGYFGFQVNSATKRQVLFSVWDPSSGSTTLVSKGDDVVDGSFGGEGTGGKSYLLFDWVAGNTYKFLTRIRPDGAGNTLYSSWFYAPEVGAWKYIATFNRPNTNTYVSSPYSFLENFINTNGYMGRKAYYSNFWGRTTGGTWIESTSTTFTVDGSGSNNQRKDYKGGVENGKFFLQNGGFFNDFVQQNTTFTRPATGTPPSVNLNTLPTH